MPPSDPSTSSGGGSSTLSTVRYTVCVMLIVAAIFVAVFNAPIRPGTVTESAPSPPEEAAPASPSSAKDSAAPPSSPAATTTAAPRKEGDIYFLNKLEQQYRHFSPEDTYLDAWWSGPDAAMTNATHRAHRVPMARALRQFRRINYNEIRDNKELDVMCTLVVMQTRNCDPFRDSLAQCVARFGFAAFGALLGERCTHSAFWGKTLRRVIEEDPVLEAQLRRAEAVPDLWKQMNRGVIWDGQIWKTGDKTRYVPPAERISAPFPPPRTCRNGCMHYPIAFAVPQSYYVEAVPRTKAFDWMPLMPKHTPAQGSYDASIEDEDVFREMYSSSYLSWTHSRAGFDCLRHYEIMAAGSVPFFYDLARIPRNTLGHLPKALLERVTKMSGLRHIYQNGGTYTKHNMYGGVNFIKHGDIREKDGFNLTEYYSLADELLAYARKYLTTRAVASYLLDTMKVPNAKRVLFFSRGPYDYLEITVIHGLQDLGIHVTVASDPKDYLYHMRTPDGKATRKFRDDLLKPIYLSTYGAAFGYAMRLGDTVSRPFISNRNDHAQIVAPLKAGDFDLVVYSASGNYPHVEDAKKHSKVAFLQYADSHGDPSPGSMQACAHGPVFIREMNDRDC